MPSDHRLAILASDAYALPATWRASDIRARLTIEPDGAAVIAFRGTTLDVRDWLRDLRTVWRFYRGIGMVHRGFLEGGLAILPAIDFKPTAGRRLILTGHSLGGALALMVGALLIAEQREHVDEIVTFGAPRTGMRDFVSVLGDTAIRQYRNGNDPVTEVPLIPYLHAREPLIAIGAASRIPHECHHAASYVDALAHTAVTSTS